MLEATGAQGRSALHSFWCEECPEPQCVTTLSLLLGFEVAQSLPYGFLPLLTHAAHRKGAAQIWIPHARVVGPGVRL